MADLPQLNISLDKTSPVICDNCENDVFAEGVLLRKASRLITMTAQDALIPIPVFACTRCQHVNDDMLPSQLRKKKES